MLSIDPIATASECALPVSAIFGEVFCPDCDESHGFFLELRFLFWGLVVTYNPPSEEALS